MQNTCDKLPECPLASTSSPSWISYFDTRRSVSVPSRNATINVYLAGSTGPVVLCLHGGGYTGLTWALLALNLKDTCQIVAPDLRGHGLTISENDLDLSAETLAADVAALWNELFCTIKPSEAQLELESSPSSPPPPPPPPPTLIVGHSMGGAIAVHTASLTLNTNSNNNSNITTNSNSSTGVSSYIPTLEGIVVIDVVEGTALSSLPFMKTVLQKRPGSFPDPSAAVEWALETGFSRNAESAAISVPAMLKKRGGGGDGNADAVFAAKEAAVAAANAAWNINTTRNNNANSRKMCTSAASELEAISEQQGQEDEHSTAAAPPAPPPPLSGRPPRPSSSIPASSSQKTSILKTSFGTTGAWVWRTPLEESSSYWEGWYRGLSTLYLNLKIPKMLILAGTDRLDRELTIGQMQGKFQLVLLSRAGHAVHEDEAAEVSAAVRGFIQRFKIGQEDKSLGVPGLKEGTNGGSLFRVPENKDQKSENKSNDLGFSRFKPPEQSEPSSS